MELNEKLAARRRELALEAEKAAQSNAARQPSVTMRKPPAESCHEDTGGVPAGICNTPTIDPKKSVGELLDEATTKGKDERAMFEAAMRQYFLTEHLVTLGEIMKLTKAQKDEMTRIMKS
jgi:hypothetical protein